jgi:hypothetical protein
LSEYRYHLAMNSWLIMYLSFLIMFSMFFA